MNKGIFFPPPSPPLSFSSLPSLESSFPLPLLFFLLLFFSIYSLALILGSKTSSIRIKLVVSDLAEKCYHVVNSKNLGKFKKYFVICWPWLFCFTNKILPKSLIYLPSLKIERFHNKFNFKIAIIVDTVAVLSLNFCRAIFYEAGGWGTWLGRTCDGHCITVLTRFTF